MRLLFLLLISTALSTLAAEIKTFESRLNEERLRAVHDARARLAETRAIAHIPQNGVYDDFKLVFARSARDIPAARKAGAKIVVLPPDQPVKYGQLDDGVLLLSAQTANSEVRMTSSGPSFLASTLSFPALDGGPLSEKQRGFSLTPLTLKPEQYLPRFAESYKQYPDEVLNAVQSPLSLGAFDQALSERACSCIALTPQVESCEAAFNCASTHVLARELTEKDIREALAMGRSYICHDWLCDPAGFMFGAANILGTFLIGDEVPYYVGGVKLGVFSPVPAHLRILRNGKTLTETDNNQYMFDTQERGTFRAEVSLKIDNELRPWIYTNPIYLGELSLKSIDILKVPLYQTSPDVVVHKDLTYTAGRKEDEQKHQLDVYHPKDKKNLPVFMFIHGGAWRTGDRWQYLPFANFLAQKGICTFVPSYRLAPESKYPAQSEDAAAALKWVVDHAAEYGGDPDRIYIGGHSAGGHLTAELVFDRRYLDAQKVPPEKIKGAICLSGVYDLVAIGDSQSSVFGSDPAARRDASPLFHVKAPAPRMLITCCQYDYLSLPQQAKDFYKAVKPIRPDAEFLYVPKENHISEMLNITEPNDLTADAILKFIK